MGLTRVLTVVFFSRFVVGFFFYSVDLNLSSLSTSLLKTSPLHALQSGGASTPPRHLLRNSGGSSFDSSVSSSLKVGEGGGALVGVSRDCLLAAGKSRIGSRHAKSLQNLGNAYRK
jgi:hypothetical protein